MNKIELKKLFLARRVVRDDEGEWCVRGNGCRLTPEENGIWDLFIGPHRANLVTYRRRAIQERFPEIVFHELEGEGWCKLTWEQVEQLRDVLSLPRPTVYSEETIQARRDQMAKMRQARVQ